MWVWPDKGSLENFAAISRRDPTHSAEQHMAKVLDKDSCLQILQEWIEKFGRGPWENTPSFRGFQLELAKAAVVKTQPPSHQKQSGKRRSTSTNSQGSARGTAAKQAPPTPAAPAGTPEAAAAATGGGVNINVVVVIVINGNWHRRATEIDHVGV